MQDHWTAGLTRREFLAGATICGRRDTSRADIVLVGHGDYDHFTSMDPVVTLGQNARPLSTEKP